MKPLDICTQQGLDINQLVRIKERAVEEVCGKKSKKIRQICQKLKRLYDCKLHIHLFQALHEESLLSRAPAVRSREVWKPLLQAILWPEGLFLEHVTAKKYFGNNLKENFF